MIYWWRGLLSIHACCLIVNHDYSKDAKRSPNCVSMETVRSSFVYQYVGTLQSLVSSKQANWTVVLNRNLSKRKASVWNGLGLVGFVTSPPKLALCSSRERGLGWPRERKKERERGELRLDGWIGSVSRACVAAVAALGEANQTLIIGTTCLPEGLLSSLSPGVDCEMINVLRFTKANHLRGFGGRREDGSERSVTSQLKCHKMALWPWRRGTLKRSAVLTLHCAALCLQPASHDWPSYSKKQLKTLTHKIFRIAGALGCQQLHTGSQTDSPHTHTHSLSHTRKCTVT